MLPGQWFQVHMCVSHTSESTISMEVLPACGGGRMLYLLLCIGSAWGQMTVDYDWAEKDCPEENASMMITEVPWGVEGRAYKTLPRGLLIAPSKIPGAGFGVLSETFIPRFTWLGEYGGEIVKLEDSDHTSWYTWLVHRNGENTAYLDGFYFHVSSYHRYINAPTRHRDENVVARECYGKMYYMTNKDILPGDELLVYYGHKYAKELGVDFNIYFEVPKALQEGGLDLNNAGHRRSVEVGGFDLFQVKYLPSSWLSRFLYEEENDEEEEEEEGEEEEDEEEEEEE